MRQGGGFIRTIAGLPVMDFVAACIIVLAASNSYGADTVISIQDRVLYTLDSRLFGQFMERPSWGNEVGPEGALIPGSNELQPRVKTMLKAMRIPVIRFPGGSNIDYLDWTDMVENVPGRVGGRPVWSGGQGLKLNNRFGYDEFLRLCQELGSEPIIVLNLGDAFYRKKSLHQAALHAAGLVAYCNAPVGAKLPAGMPDWPALRARNGHPAPYGVKYFQIGNETWLFNWPKDKDGGFDRWQVDCAAEYVKLIRAVDPSVSLLMDGFSHPQQEYIARTIGNGINYLVNHVYSPWEIVKVTRKGAEYPPEKLSARDAWYAWVDCTGTSRNAGFWPRAGETLDFARKNGYGVAITEWNWNGWWQIKDYNPPLDSVWAKGVGAASFLHAMMREGDVVRIGCQSMLVGNSWGITAIRADKLARTPAFMLPTGQVTTLYSRYHGEKVLQIEGNGIPVIEQNIGLNDRKPSGKLALIDAICTASDDALYLHAINRSFDEDISVLVRFPESMVPGKGAVLRTLTGRLNDVPRRGESAEVAKIGTERFKLRGHDIRVRLPKRSVSVLEIALGKGRVPPAMDEVFPAVGGGMDPVREARYSGPEPVKITEGEVLQDWDGKESPTIGFGTWDGTVKADAVPGVGRTGGGLVVEADLSKCLWPSLFLYSFPRWSIPRGTGIRVQMRAVPEPPAGMDFTVKCVSGGCVARGRLGPGWNPLVFRPMDGVNIECGELMFQFTSDKPWKGRLIFDDIEVVGKETAERAGKAAPLEVTGK
jgi:alpha-N-arabinofuranosidase